MQTVREGYRGLSIFVGLNVDRIMTVAAISGALVLASWIQSF
jgi:hypothetical protein